MGDLARQKQPPGKGLKICRKMAQNALQMADFSTQSAICEIAGAGLWFVLGKSKIETHHRNKGQTP